MRSRMQRRIMSLFALVAFSAAMASDAYGLHSCPHHDALPGESVHTVVADADIHTGAAGHSDSAHHAMAGSAHDGAAPFHTDHGHADVHAPGENDDHGVCTCVGACSANPSAAPLERTPVTLAAPLSGTSQILPAYAQPHTRTTPYLLPWANAPPVSASR